jgi:hypothetical protein
MCDERSMPTPVEGEKCVKAPDPTQKDVETSLPLILAKMGFDACRRKNGQIYLRPTYPPNPPISPTNSSSLSCETLEDITRSYLSAKSSITCLVNKISQCSSETTQISNSIIVENGKDALIDCTCRNPAACTAFGFNLSNMVSANMIINNTTQSSVVTDVARDAMMDFIEALFKKTLTADPANPNSFPNTPDGARRIEEVKEELNVFLSSMNWTEIVQTAISSIFVSNSIKLINEGIIRGDSCNLSNTVISSLVADKLIVASIDDALRLPKTKGYLKAMSDHDKTAFPIETNWVPIILGIVAGLAGLGLILFLILRKKNLKPTTKIN